MRRMAKVGVYCDFDASKKLWERGENHFTSYISEVLAHAGIPFVPIYSQNELQECSYDLLIAVLTDASDDSVLWDYVADGGMIISYSGLNEWASRLGCDADSVFGPGYVDLSADFNQEIPLRFLQARPWSASEQGEYLQNQAGVLKEKHPNRSMTAAGLMEFSIGNGSFHRWSIDIPATIVGLQQGTRPVTEDGPAAPDGSANIADDLLKADDGFELDWEIDRQTTETGAVYFAHPYADHWREILLQQILKLTVQRGLVLPFLGYWPDHIKHVATISHDSDRNLDEHAETTLDLLRTNGVNSTWCMLKPGYSPHIYDRVKEDGHELAYHYNGKDAPHLRMWGEEEFKHQLEWLKQAVEVQRITSNKNHYTRFEGWGELFRWCESNGIEADQSRGPSKKGNIGFLFGTCHPYFPIAWVDEQNRLYNVLEIGFLTQDLDHERLADSSVVKPFYDQVEKVDGVAHFLFHQFHLHSQDAVYKAFGKVVTEGKKRGFTFWTSQQINDWERWRRTVRITACDEHGIPSVASDRIKQNTVDVHYEAVVWVPVLSGEQLDPQTKTEEKFGVMCKKHTFLLNDVPVKGETDV